MVTDRERERERKRGSQQKNHFLCSRWNSGKSRGSQPMLVNSVGRITTALFWMMTLYNDHDAIPVLLQLLRSTTLYTYYIWCLSVSLLWWSRHDTIPLRAKRGSREYIIPIFPAGNEFQCVRSYTGWHHVGIPGRFSQGSQWVSLFSAPISAMLPIRHLAVSSATHG